MMALSGYRPLVHHYLANWAMVQFWPGAYSHF